MTDQPVLTPHEAKMLRKRLRRQTERPTVLHPAVRKSFRSKSTNPEYCKSIWPAAKFARPGRMI